MTAVEAILHLVDQLDPAEQAELQAALQVRSLDEFGPSELAELNRRGDAVRNGTATLYGWQESLQYVRNEALQRKNG